MNKAELVSIITPSYNSEEYISQTIDSVLAQTIQNWEMIVVDDASSDNCIQIIEKHTETDKRIKLIVLKENSGAAVARNTAINAGTGKYIAFLDSDDLWDTEKLKKQITFMESNQIDFSFTAYNLIDSKDNLLGITIDSNQSGSFSYNDMLRKKATMGCSTVMLRRSAFKDLRMPLLRTGQDYALWLKLLKTGKNAFILNEVLTQYRILPNSISRNKFKKAKRQWQIYRKIEGLSILTSGISFIFYAWRAIFRK